MRSFSVTRMEFDNFLWGAIAGSSAKNESDLELALRVIRKLKAISEPNVIEGEMPEGAIPGRHLKNKFSELLTLEEDEWTFIKSRLSDVIPRLSLVVAEEFFSFLSKIKNASTVSVVPHVEETS